MKRKKEINIHVRLDDRVFRQFCHFDAFRRRRRWLAPVLAGMLLITLSLAMLLFVPGQSGSAAGLLMGLGIAVPMLSFGLYFIQLYAQIARQNLKSAPPVYSLSLSESAVRVTNDQKSEPPVELTWDQLWAAFRGKGCIYLYVNSERALLLPDGQADVSADELWRFLQSRLGEKKCAELAR